MIVENFGQKFYKVVYVGPQKYCRGMAENVIEVLWGCGVWTHGSFNSM